MEDAMIAGRAVEETYRVIGRADQYDFLINAVQASGGRVIYASESNMAPLYIGVQMSSDERIGLLIYPFRITHTPVKNRPDDEVRGQLRYGSKDSWEREHPVTRDVAGVDVTMVLGIDLEAEIILGLDATLWDPLPMGISFYAKDVEIDQAKSTGWHVWEKPNKAGNKRSEARSPTSFETVVTFTPDRLIDYARLERRATSLRLDTPLRYSAAKAMTARSTAEDALRRHVLEEQFALTSKQILDIIGGRNRLAVAVRGGVAEYHLEFQLKQEPGVAEVKRLDLDAQHDFNVTLNDGRLIRIECKNASPKNYANGDFKVEVQKTRASQNDPASRFYPVDRFDVVAACLFSPTGRWEFRYRATTNMNRHQDYPDRLAPLHAVTEDWKSSLINVDF